MELLPDSCVCSGKQQTDHLIDWISLGVELSGVIVNHRL
jgi:hypothetical protein